MKSKLLIFGALLVISVLVLAGCQSANTGATEAPQPQQTAAPAPVCPTAAPCPTQPPAPTPVVEVVPFEEAWVNSPHNDAESEAFNHWNEEDPAEVPTSCAKCHSTPGHLDFLGADGTTALQVDNPAPIGTTIQCVACHNEVTAVKTSVVFPSGVEVTGLGPEARCMECHQGRSSKVQIDAALERFGVTAETLDEVPAPVEDATLGFVNIHYYAAAATMYGTITKGGYEYEGKSYDSKFDHVAGYNTCVGCHNPHSTELKIEECAVCHTGVAAKEDLKNVRMAGSLADYDGDGDIEEGIALEVEGLQGMLLTAIQAYATEVAGTAIGYNPAAYPYFFADPNADGTIDEAEAISDNGFKSWTGRLLKAAYNYQTSLKDPGSYAHGGKYIIQLLYDSIEDLNTQISTPVDLSTANRIDNGHFAGSEEAFRHWDEDGLVPADCAKCHSASGLPTFLDEASRARDGVTGINIAVHPTNGLECRTCHNDVSTFTRYTVEQVKFPSGAVVAFDNQDANLCMECHQGRESKASVDRAITASGLGDDEFATEESPLAFRNPHYFAAAATLWGTEVKGAYEFEGQEYNGRFAHVPGFNNCVACHDAHALRVKAEACGTCHQGVQTEADLVNIRMTPGDFDGDGDEAEGLAGEVQTMHDALWAAIQEYAAANETPIRYDAHAYPYFFADTNANGEADEGEGAFTTVSPNLLRAAYNFLWVAKDPGAFAHNGQYILQILYDSLGAVGGSTTGMTRPAVIAPEGE